MERLLIILALFTLGSCVRVNSYHCPSIFEQYKVMTVKDEKYLGRKHHPFKKALPKITKREGYAGDQHNKIHH